MPAIDIEHVEVPLNAGKSVSIPAWTMESGQDGPSLLLTAAQHGNEVQGSETIRRFLELAKPRIRKGRITAVPLVNLPAIRDRRPHIRMRPEQPYGKDKSHNMNRWWPGKRSGNDTARIPFALDEAFGQQATHVVDFHCWEKHAAPAVLIRDRPDMRDLAARLGHRFVMVRPPSDSTLGGYFCATGRIGLTYEFSGQYTIMEHEVQRGLRMLTNFAKLVGLFAGKPVRGDDPVLFSDSFTVTEVQADKSGLFMAEPVRLCDPIDKGELLGHILSDEDLSWTPVFCPADGFVLKFGASRPNCDVALPGHHPYVVPGERLASIALVQPGG